MVTGKESRHSAFTFVAKGQKYGMLYHLHSPLLPVYLIPHLQLSLLPVYLISKESLLIFSIINQNAKNTRKKRK